MYCQDYCQVLNDPTRSGKDPDRRVRLHNSPSTLPADPSDIPEFKVPFHTVARLFEIEAKYINNVIG